jgi:hypothetical protein
MRRRTATTITAIVGRQEQSDELDLNYLVRELTKVELRGDAVYLDSALAGNFIGIGPRGFMLTKDERLERHRSGDLKYDVFDRDEVAVRVHGDAAIVTSREMSKAKYKGQEVPAGQYRSMQVFVREGGQWLLAGVQLGPIMDPPPAPQ